MENSGIPKSKQRPQTLEAGVDYNAFVKLDMIKTNIVNFIGNGNNLYICSNETGNGKTSWSIKLLLKYFDSIWAGNGFKVRGYFQHVPTFLNTLKDFSKSHDALKNTLEDVDIVVWDDIAASKLTDYDINQLLIYIDSRVSGAKSNIFTGNLTSYDSLNRALGGRLASRIWNCSTVIELKGKDRRNGKFTDNL